MIDFVAARFEMVSHLRKRIKDQRVIEVMAQVPREYFLPVDERHLAYVDTALPIGFKQAISQPYIVALMTEALCLTGNEKVLEIGTGSGYQAAILSRLSRKVITVERIPQLAETATLTLNKLGYTNIEVYLAEETLGWQRESPYDAIMVTAAARHLPSDLIAQLKIGGCMVIPIGPFYVQELNKVTRQQTDTILEKLVTCQFVPLIGEGA